MQEVVGSTPIFSTRGFRPFSCRAPPPCHVERSETSRTTYRRCVVFFVTKWSRRTRRRHAEHKVNHPQGKMRPRLPYSSINKYLCLPLSEPLDNLLTPLRKPI